MPNLSPKRFSNPDTLKHVGDALLIRLLSDYRDFFIARGVDLPQSASATPIDYEALAAVLMTPDTDTPHDLAEILYFMHEMSTPESMDNLLDAITQREFQFPVGADLTPADVAVHVWLVAPDLLREKHVEQYLLRPRSFVSYVTDEQPVPPFVMPTLPVVRGLEAAMDDWFERKKRGRGCRVYIHHRDGLVWFLVRHGQPFKREGSLEDGVSGSVFYRPETHDVLIYAPETGELRIHTSTKGEREMYRQSFGLHFFGRSDFFPGEAKYTLDPFKQGRQCLVCTDIPGIDSIVLKEIEFTIPGAIWEREIHKSDDVFTAFEYRNFEIREHLVISRACFKVQFSDSQKARTVVIRPSNNAQYGRDEDAVLVERWLNARGFILSTNET